MSGSKRARLVNNNQSPTYDTLTVETELIIPHPTSTQPPDDVGSLYLDDGTNTSTGFEHPMISTSGGYADIPLSTYVQFTPQLTCGTAVTLTDADGCYTLTGNICHVTMHMVWSEDHTSESSGYHVVMPFSKDASISTLAMPVGQWQDLAPPTNFQCMGLRFVNSSATAYFVWIPTDTTSTIVNVKGSDGSTTGQKILTFSASYPIQLP